MFEEACSARLSALAISAYSVIDKLAVARYTEPIAFGFVHWIFAGGYDKKQRLHATVIPAEERFAGDGQIEINKGMTEEQVREEAKRCLSCGYCFGCGTCWSFCQDNAIVKPADGGYPYKYKLELCQGCKKCHEECPCGFIEMQ